MIDSRSHVKLGVAHLARRLSGWASRSSVGSAVRTEAMHRSAQRTPQRLLSLALAVCVGGPLVTRSVAVGQDQAADIGVVVPLPPRPDLDVVIVNQVRLGIPPAVKHAEEFPIDVFAAVEDPGKPMVLQAPEDVVIFPALAAADNDQLVQQFLPQFRQMTRAECHLIQTVCKLSKSQRKTLDGQEARLSKEAARKYAEFQQKMQHGQLAGGGYPEPRKLLQDAFAPVLKGCLTPDQAARYKDELVKRGEEVKQVTVRNLVAKLDEELVLTEDQRRKLSDSLVKNWQEVWSQSLEMMQYNNDMFPDVPDQFVSPFLNGNQKALWQGIPKNGGFFWGGFGMANVMIDNEGDVVEVAVPEAAAVEVEVQVERPAPARPDQDQRR